MGAMASQITSFPIVYSTVWSGADQRKNLCSASLAFVRRIKRRPVNSPHEGPVTRKMFPFDYVIMCLCRKQHLVRTFRQPYPPLFRIRYTPTYNLTCKSCICANGSGQHLWSAKRVVMLTH